MALSDSQHSSFSNCLVSIVCPAQATPCWGIMAHSLLHSLYLLFFLTVLEFLVHRISFLSMPDPKPFPR